MAIFRILFRRFQRFFFVAIIAYIIIIIIICIVDDLNYLTIRHTIHNGQIQVDVKKKLSSLARAIGKMDEFQFNPHPISIYSSIHGLHNNSSRNQKKTKKKT